jgi:hypothetical protein
MNIRYAQNVLGKKALQFDYFPRPIPAIGDDAILAVADFEPFGETKLLESSFERIEKEPDLEIRHFGKLWRRFEIYRCYGYLGGRELLPAAPRE